MEKDPVSFSIGRYKCLRTIGKGGMGEVLLAYDPVCDRQVAIKRIRTDLEKHEVIKNRFFKEAKLTAQLTHPGIVSIFSIHPEENNPYYTMPYIEGQTLKQILRNAHENTTQAKLEGSIPALLPIFRSICMTISYVHSKGILHRDLKPENILVGTFGEVIVLDWGLAQMSSETSEELDLSIVKEEEDPELTHPGKIIGTVAFMTPERAMGKMANFQTDIYALGVILYQILTLYLPFKRSSIKEFRKTHPYEKLLDPEEVAPYRDVPPRLSRMVKKCLDPDPHKRYQQMDELIHDLTSHMEGRSEWFESAKLDIHRKKDWEFQENVMMSKHIAITRSPEGAEWVSIMVSKAAFAENTRLDTRVRLGEGGAGIGFLLSMPEATERENPLEGFCLWIGSESNPGLQLFRNTVQVMHLPELCLNKEIWHTLSIEKIDNNIHFFLDGIHYLTYLSYLPIFGTHIGVLARDDNFEIDELVLSVGSQNLLVSCLSIPDAFLASKDYKRALGEYRRIGYSFPGHAEGREALFRAGITLLEQAKESSKAKKTEEYYALALEEFAKLHTTPGAPLEYLGKALVYQSLRDHTEEIKCLELGLRRYYKHPLVSVIKEQILYRMQKAAQTNRRSAYQLILIALRLLPEVVQSGDFHRLFHNLVSNWERLPFLECTLDPTHLGKNKIDEIHFAIPIAFWLGSPYILLEIYNELIKIEPLDAASIGDIIYSLFELGSYGLGHKLIEQSKNLKEQIDPELNQVLELLYPLHLCHTQSLDAALKAFFALNCEDIGVREFRTLSYLLQDALRHNQEKSVHLVASHLLDKPLSREDRIYLDSYRIWAYLKEGNLKKAEEIFDTYPLELLNQEGTPLHPLFGCYLQETEGDEIAHIHFAGMIETSFPRSWALLGHELTNKISDTPAWYSTSFLWERRRLYQQLTLYYHITQNPELEAYYRYLEREEYIYIPE
ncbi:MAG: Serine/threonine-protein kinase PknD [Chlamydiales bacterium]|nr:Serine/threonine-protein kinase PknD [Chlamydiales bacterium]